MVKVGDDACVKRNKLVSIEVFNSTSFLGLSPSLSKSSLQLVANRYHDLYLFFTSVLMTLLLCKDVSRGLWSCHLVGNQKNW